MSVRIDVDLGERSYPVVIDGGLSLAAHKQIAGLRPDRIFAIFDAQLFVLHGKAITRDLKKGGVPVELLSLPISESSKSRKTVDEIHDWLLSGRISRSDLIIACGGGVTTDLVGYAAATILRGVSWGVVPTTLIGMIDAAIGGKTGVNHWSAKNAIGAFWQPKFVYAYTPFLSTLDARQVNAGVGELVKYAGLIGEPLVSAAKALVIGGIEADPKRWEKLIAVAATYKAALVSEDERDVGVRQYLNLGHTFAHGIEQSLGYGKLLHGEAVSLGLLAAIYLSGWTISGAAAKLAVYRLLVQMAITCIPQHKVNVNKALTAMQLDKKRCGKDVHFVLLKRPGRPVLATDVGSREVRQALEESLQYYRMNGGRCVADTRY